MNRREGVRIGLYQLRQWLPVAPVVLLLWAGWQRVPLVVYADLMALIALSVLVCNPFGVLTAWLAPVSRGCFSVAVVLSVCAFRVPDVSLYCRACLVLLSVLVTAGAVFTSRSLLLVWQVRQSPQVDRVLSYLSHGEQAGEKWAAVNTWDRYGCRETRALLHQTIGVECPENLITSWCKAVYLLAFLHGSRAAETENKRMKKELKAKGEEIRYFQERTQELNERVRAIPELEKQIQDKERQCERLKTAYQRLKIHADEAFSILDAQAEEDAGKDRDTLILELVAAKKSYRDVAAEVGVSPATVANVVKKSKTERTRTNGI